MDGDTYSLGGHRIRRMGFGAMQLPGPRAFGPPRNRQAAIDVLRCAVRAGVNHIDTAQFYGPDVANELIRDALYPYPKDLIVVSKVGARRDSSGDIHAAQRPRELREGVLMNLDSLQLDQIPVVNLRRHPEAGIPLDEQLETMVAMRDEGLIGGIGLSNVTVEEYQAANALTEVACVQNAYNLADRLDQLLFDICAADGVPYVPFFPLGSGFQPESPVLTRPAVVSVASRLGVSAAKVALAWLLSASPNVLLIPGTSSLAHLRENLESADLALDAQALAELG
jgi:aryl-alcohol dehydrogenase-like predicted oxidoreductase